VNNWSTVV